MVQEAELVVAVNTQQVKKAANDLDSLADTGKKADTQMQKLTKSFKVQKGATQNAAFQLQDLTVQLEGGTNASRALAQQLPQMFGAFGAGGAILGLFASLASIAFADFIDGAFDSADAVGDLEKALEGLDGVIKKDEEGIFGLTAALKELEGRSEQSVVAKLQNDSIKLEDAIKGVRGEVSELTDDLIDGFFGGASLSEVALKTMTSVETLAERIGSRLKISKENATTLVELVQETSRIADNVGSSQAFSEIFKVEEFSSSFDTLLTSIKNPSEELRDFSDKIRDLATQTNKAEESQRGLEEAIAKVGQTSKGVFELDEGDFTDPFANQFSTAGAGDPFAIDELGPGSRGQFNDAERLIELDEKRTQAAEREKERRVEIAKSERQATLRVYSSLFSTLSNVLANSDQKNFQRSKNAATAGALIDGTAATLSAFDKGAESGGLVGGALAAAAAAATTGLLIAQIQSAKPPSGSRALGGQVRPGESYRVGEYGPETLVMGSQGGNILPAGAANDSGRMETVVNVTVNGGSGNQDVQTNTTQVSDRKQIIDVVVSEMGNQNSQSRRALQQTSNVRSVGGR